MKEIPVAEDLRNPLQTESPDEARLLLLFRSLNQKDRSQYLFELTHSFFSRYVADGTNQSPRSADQTYFHEEIEEELRLICPRELLRDADDALYAPVLFNGLWVNAWGEIAPVILGSDAHDGQRADELYRAVRESCRANLRAEHSFQRSDALLLIQAWREEALQRVFLPNAAEVNRIGTDGGSLV